MKAIKDYNGEHVFIGDPDNDIKDPGNIQPGTWITIRR